MRGYRYAQGGQRAQEAVDFDIVRGGKYVTTCVVNVQLLLAGILVFPCGNGDDYKITAGDRLEILRFVQRNRERILKAEPVKTLQGWRDSGLSSFEDYVKPGDEVAEDIVEDLINSVPPVSTSASCTQTGEPYSMVLCENGNWRNTFLTFHRKTEGVWIYDGTCVGGSNVNRGDGLTSVERAIRIWEGK